MKFNIITYYSLSITSNTWIIIKYYFETSIDIIFSFISYSKVVFDNNSSIDYNTSTTISDNENNQKQAMVLNNSYWH